MTLPAKSKTNQSTQKNILTGCGVGGAAAVIILVITMAFPGSTVTSDNSIFTKEKQSLRVMIQNTGNQPLTNITIDYGDGDKDFIPTLMPGKTIILSPPDGNSLQFVRVTADGGIDIYKAYREPIAMPGMMGS
jgi:P pilus assembly chaperone PapD